MSRLGDINEDHGRRQSSSLANGMEKNHPVCSSGEKRTPHWRSYKLIIDPALKKGSHKLYRYDGQHFNIPDSGMPPVDMVRDPRIGRLWTKYKETDLPVPTFKIDDSYIGPVPPKEVTFARLNDNIREGFLKDMCKKFGDIEEVEILYNPKNKKHLGVAKVVFENVKSAKDAVQTLHNTSVMGNMIHVELDPKGENRLRYFQLLINGTYTPRTLPVGGVESRGVSPRAIADALLEPIRRLSEGSSSVVGGASTPGTATPLSQDTAYFSQRQETPQSQGTPHTPRPSGTPFSQDSSYSSRQATPTYQPGRQDSSGGFKSRRHEPPKFQDAYNRRTERHYVHRNEPLTFKPHHPPPPEPPAPSFSHTPPPPVSAGFKPGFSPYQAPMPQTYPHLPPAEPPYPQPVQREGDYRRPPLPSTPDFATARDKPETPPMPEPPLVPVVGPTTPPARTPSPCPSPGTPPLESERHSLDSRIEMLLKEKRTKLPFLSDRAGDSDTEVRMEGSPISSSSSQLSPIPPSQPAQRPLRPSSTGLEDISPTPLPDSDDEEPVPGTAALLQNSRASPPTSSLTKGISAGDPIDRHYTPPDKTDMGNQSSGEDMEISDDEMPGTPQSGDKAIVVNSSLSPMHQSISIPPPGYPPLPPPQTGFALPPPPLPPHSSGPGPLSHLPGPPGVHPAMLHPLHPYPPGMMPMMPVDLVSCLPQWGSVSMSFQMQTQMLSRMAQSQSHFPYPHYMSGTGAAAAAAVAVAAAGTMAFGTPYAPLSIASTPSGSVSHEQPWPFTSMPKFNPAVPPPGYEAKKEDPHKATVDGVLMVIVKELKAIMKRDLNRKMVEVVAFRAFDEWWERKERSAKASLTPVKAGEGKEEEKEKPKPKEIIASSLLENWNKGEGLGYEGMGLGISLRGAIRLPSFKVKRKEPPDTASTADSKRVRPSTPVDDEMEDEESERDRDMAGLQLDGSRQDGDGSTARRRHARPLDSEGEEEEEEPSGKEEESSEREEAGEEDSERLSSGKEVDDEDEDGEEDRDSDSSDSESSDSSDEEAASSASSKASSDSSSASGSSSDYESSSGEEAAEEEDEARVEEEEDKGEEAQSSSTSSSSSSSSDEEEEEEEDAAAAAVAAVLEPKVPSSPPRAEPRDEALELAVLEQQRLRMDPEAQQRAIREAEEAVGSLRSGMDDLRPPSPKGLPDEEPESDLEVPLPKEPVEDEGTLRPPTPTGSLADSDHEVRPKVRPEPEEVPRTPGREHPTPLDSNSSATPLPSLHLPLPLPLPLHPTTGTCSTCPSPLHAPGVSLVLSRPRLPTDEDLPRTPGRDPLERPRSLCKSQSTEGVPVTPGSDAPLTGNSLVLGSPHVPGSPFTYPAQSPVPNAGIPRTPGRDLSFGPVFPSDPFALAAGLPLHRKTSATSDTLEEKAVFKEPIASLPSQAAPSSFPGTPQDAAAPALGSDPAPADAALAGLPTDMPVSVLPDAMSSKRKPGRPKSKKGLQPAPPDHQLSPNELPAALTVASLPPEPVCQEPAALVTDLPPGAVKREPSSLGLDFREEEPQMRTQTPDTHTPDTQPQTVLSDMKSLFLEGPVQKTRRARRGWEELLLSMHPPVSSPPKPAFLPRSDFEEMTILYDIWNDGIDEEDIRHLQVTYDRMLQLDNSGNDWLNDTLWVHHPPTNLNVPGVKRKRRDDCMRDHVTGCARSEGYYKIDKKDKLKYLNSTRLPSDEPMEEETQGVHKPAQPHASTRSGSERRSEQRRLQSSFSCDSDLLKFNQLKFRKKKIRFCRSGIHDWGLFAMEPIAADEMVIEYVGQNIRQVIADMREKRYEEEGIGSSYMFRVDHDTIIDATKCGNFARFINHSCNPNCYAKVITVESQKKIVIYSKQPITVNEEITYDYKFPIEDVKIPCLCGAENCRGTLN